MKHAIIVAIGLGALCQSALAQSVPQWTGFDPFVPSMAMTVWDEDGTGPGRPVLVVGNIHVPGGGGSPTHGRISTYDGRRWKTIGQQFSIELPSWMFHEIVAAHTSGIGSPQPGLYVAGRFDEVSGKPAETLAHWDGSTWSSLASVATGHGRSLRMFDEDGKGPEEANLFIGGNFFEVEGIQKPALVRWDGTAFTEVGGGIAGRFPTTIPYVDSMIEFDDDGPGPRESALYVAGSFYYVDGQHVNSIARWDGTNWEPLEKGLYGLVTGLAIFDADGEGSEPPMLYAAGSFIHDPGGADIDHLARWDGQSWSPVPGFTGGGLYSIAVHDDDGDGPNKPALFVSGLFTSIGGVQMNYIAKWDGTEWYPLETGFTGFNGSSANAMQVFDEDNDPSTPDGLYAAGNFFIAGGIPSTGFARWGMPNPVCFADCDETTGNGVLDIFDFLCFQTAFVTGDPYACDCDTSGGNGVCDIFDFLCYQNVFVNGCP